MSVIRTRWAALGAAAAITLGGGGIGLVSATVGSGERTVFVPITPCRIIDTRPDFQVGPRATPIGAGETHSVSAHGNNGNCTIPTDAVGLSLNVTAVDGSTSSSVPAGDHELTLAAECTQAGATPQGGATWGNSAATVLVVP